MDTIFALASAQGKAGVAVVRLSGDRAFEAAERLAANLPEPRHSALRVLRRQDGEYLDQALVLPFARNASFTGEDTVEFHLHGSIAIIRAVLEELDSIPGLRLAEPGEFTRRALENGRLDLTQVEALSDLIESETEAQRRQALRVFSGALGGKVDAWRLRLIEAASLLEATMDFADEEVPVDVTSDVVERLESVLEGICQELSGMRAAERIRQGFEVAIIGPPNAGKSTLLNYLAGRDAAITSEVAGTTRDIIEVRMDVDGFALTLLDTAGLRDTEDLVERLGVERTVLRAQQADLRVHLVPAGETPLVPVSEGDIVLRAKQDSPGQEAGISGLTGSGVDDLLNRLKQSLGALSSGAGLSTRERHRSALGRGESHIRQALALVIGGTGEYDVASEEIRLATRALASLIGKVDVDDLLDHIFSTFCVGK